MTTKNFLEALLNGQKQAMTKSMVLPIPMILRFTIFFSGLPPEYRKTSEIHWIKVQRLTKWNHEKLSISIKQKRWIFWNWK
jgi:hypothetical protein